MDWETIPAAPIRGAAIPQEGPVLHRRPTAAASIAAAALCIGAAGASAAFAAPAPKAKLATSNQIALLSAHSAVVNVVAPAHSSATIKLYADHHLVSRARKLDFRRATRARTAVALTRSGITRLRDCTKRNLELRMSVRRGKHVTVVRDHRVLALDASHCPAPKPATDTPVTPDPTPQQPTPDNKPVDTPKADGSLFRVGTAVVDITPDKPMPVGGYGANYIVNNGAHDPLQVRAFFVGHGKKAVTFVSVDSQGWFAAYQTPNVGDGAQDARNDAATALAARGYDVSPANVVVSATHDHAAPTIMGIWGHTDPAYVHRIKEAAVKAVLDAESNAREAELWSATGTIKGLVSQVQGTDQMAGYAVDTELPILWAREPGTGATIATYADVPTHVDQYNPISSPEHQWSADYPGWVRDHLAQLLGGTAVIAESTLGRQESIGADSTYDEVAEQGRFITNQVMRALTHAHRINDTTLAASAQMLNTAAANQNLLLAMACNHYTGSCPFGPEPASNGGTGTWFLPNPANIFTINRSLSAPWFIPPSTIGTTATVARVGDQVYATAPGEAFDEVTSAVQRMFDGSEGIRGVHMIDHAGDQLGYYWDQRPGIYPDAQLAQSDFARFNVGSNLAQDNVDAIWTAGQALGLTPTTQHPYAELENPNAFSQPTIQFYSNRVETADPAVSFYGTAKKAQKPGALSTSFGSTAATPSDSKIAWDFGDGTTDALATGTRFTHTFPGPGTYRVQASVTDNLGATYRWVQMVRIDKPLAAAVDQQTKNGQVVLTTQPVGGQRWDVVAAHWTFSDGTTAEGTTVTRPAGSGEATVTIVDGAGNTATLNVAIA
jgi:PKD domain